jgi:biopolymer transport protein ExbD
MIHVEVEQNNSFAALAVDLTPMIDILFIVLVFFILTANPVEHALKVDLPAKGAEQAEALTVKNSIQITLFTEKKWALNDRVFTDWPATKTAFKAAISNAPEREIIIATARDASVEQLLELMAFLQQENLQAAQILMDPATSG